MDNREALKTFMTGENFYLQHYLGAHREELNGEHGYTFQSVLSIFMKFTLDHGKEILMAVLIVLPSSRMNSFLISLK